MEKPKVLYHASHERGIELFEPRNETPRYEGEVNLVFATPYPAVAAMFLAPRNVSVEIGRYGDNHVIFIEATEAEYKRSDQGGAIYILSSETFETSKTLGMGETEWYSSVPVKPLEKTIYETSLEAMKKHGVRIHFVDAVTMQKIRQNPSAALSIVTKESPEQ